MKRLIKSMFGVTLLEVLLILAVAALIIVMSVRYYQSASATQQANSAFSMVQGITAAAGQFASLQNGSFSNINDSKVKNFMPQKSLTFPWGADAEIAYVSPTEYTVTVANPPQDVCNILEPRLKADTHYDVTDCTPGGNLAYTYKSSPT